MAEKVTDYTPKSQNFIDTDLFDVSKHVTQTSGALVIGKRYTILDFNTGDNFTNVANVISGTINTTGCVFDAIGTTPTTYSNGSTLAHYETQSYTYAELKAGLAIGAKVYKALLTQTGMNAPTSIESVNTTLCTISYSYDAVGQYMGTCSSPILLAGKTHFNIQNGGIVSADTQFEIQRIDDSTFYINSLQGAVLTDNSLLNTSVQIEVYP